MSESDSHVGVASGCGRLRPDESVLRRNVYAMLIAAVITVAVQLGTYFAASGAVVTLLVSLLWVVIAAPVFAAGGRTVADGLLRGGTVVDAGIVVLIVLVATGPAVGAIGAIKIYLIWCSLALAGCSVAMLGRNVAGRHILAAVAVLLVLAVAAGPFWANGIIMAAEPPRREQIAFGVRAANPVFAVSECLADDVKFVWNERPILYEYTVLGRDAPGVAAAWYVTAGAYGVISLAVGVIAAARRRRERRPPARR